YLAMVITVIGFLAGYMILPAEKHYLTIPIGMLINGIAFFTIHIIQNKGLAIIRHRAGAITEKLWAPKGKLLLEHLTYAIPTPRKILRYSQEKVSKYGAPYIFFGIFCCLNFTLPYFMWTSEFAQGYNL